jgi:acetyl/propionyl-CoA carboxylase alpha subunit
MNAMKTAPIRTLLIANRGEIAARIARTCRTLGIRSAAVFADPDRDALHVREADIALHIGPAPASASYLNTEAILDAARRCEADAIHPGYGFLSENAAFARAVMAAGFTWVGPHPEAIEKMGSKAGAKAIMEANGVPVIPGYNGEDQTEERLLDEARRVGFPLLVKASAGGGGKGMVIVRDPSALTDALHRARREAAAAFGDDRLILERYFEKARHVEFQIFGDRHGNALHLFERECSIQRRYQKVLEESPSPVLEEDLRQRMGQAAVQAAKALRYDNAGTVEFILLPDGSFYFLEVNTRLQVEHPVTELITGQDLVRWQLEVAEGKPLPLAEEALERRGYALELRLYAEDPASGFLPASGPVHCWKIPQLEGFRCDSGVQSGSVIGTDFDPMIAKLITWGENRQQAFRRMQYALDQLVCLGLQTNQAFLSDLVQHPDVMLGQYHTHFLDENPELLRPRTRDARYQRSLALALSAREVWQQQHHRALLRNLPAGWRNVPGGAFRHRWQMAEDTLEVRYQPFADGVEGQAEPEGSMSEQSPRLRARVLEAEGMRFRMDIDGTISDWYFAEAGDRTQSALDTPIWVHHPSCGPQRVLRPADFPLKAEEGASGGHHAPMPGQVSAVLVEPGQEVEAGQALVVLYSMKMEHTIAAAVSGRVHALHVSLHDKVESGQALITLHEAPEAENPKTEDR